MLGVRGNLAGRKRDGWMMSLRIWNCFDFKAGGGELWRGKNGQKLPERPGSFEDCSAQGLIDSSTSAITYCQMTQKTIYG
jgi:hypothetical protein